MLQLQRTIGNRAVGLLLAEIGRLPSRQTPVQRQPEDEELLQGQFTGECIQCQAPEEEELMQGKFEPVQRQGPEEEEELLQGKFTSDCIQCQIPEEEELMQGQGLTLQGQPNRTGMPDHLKSGLETLSGMDISGVRVHYGSPRPAQLNALAYTRGQEIHVAPGQERHLPHEGWHAVQQMQGRVRPTGKLGAMPLNDIRTLESEADSMGCKALQQVSQLRAFQEMANNSPLSVSRLPKGFGVLQRAIDVDAEVRDGSVVISYSGFAPEFKGRDDAKNNGWNGVEKYKAEAKVWDNKSIKLDETNNDYLVAKAGHVLAKQNGGKGSDPNNVFAQDGGVNNGPFRKNFENPMRAQLDVAAEDDDVDFELFSMGKTSLKVH